MTISNEIVRWFVFSCLRLALFGFTQNKQKTKTDRHSPSQIRWRSESFEFDANHSCFCLLWSVSSHFRIKYNNLSRKNVALAQRCAKNKHVFSRVANLWGGKSIALSSSRCRMAVWRNALLDDRRIDDSNANFHFQYECVRCAYVIRCFFYFSFSLRLRQLVSYSVHVMLWDEKSPLAKKIRIISWK